MSPKTSLPKWEVIGGDTVGPVFSLTIATDPLQTAFAATSAGLFTSSHHAGCALPWQPLPGIVGAVTAVEVSPNYAQDQTVLMGNNVGIYVSPDAGANWIQSRLPRKQAHITSLRFSSTFAQDHSVFAGTLEDGIFCSTDGGENWSAWNFQLLDPSVLTLAVSAKFETDGVVYAGTASGLFRSYNAGRTWQELSLPCAAPALLSVAVTSSRTGSEVILAGTENDGLFVSRDGGKTWLSGHKRLSAECISAIVITNQGVLVATEDGIYLGEIDGQTWQKLRPQLHILSLAAGPHRAIIGLSAETESDPTHASDHIRGSNLPVTQ